MKKNMLIFGLIAGIILGSFIFFMTWLGKENNNWAGNMFTTYTAMIIAFSFIFVGVKNFRDKYNHGVVGFGKAFLAGLGIAFIGSTLYVIAWLISYYVFLPDFMEKYANHMIQQARNSGLSQERLTKKIAEINSMREMYKNTVFVVLFTYLEVLPVGILISLITAFILRRRQPRAGIQVA